VSKSLVLAEKPSVAREIAKTLGCRQNNDGYIAGERYIVTWALGHLVTLADPESYHDDYKTWSLETLPMLPEKMRLVVIKETSKQFGIVQGLTKRADVSDIIIATDSGREGELVARWILIKSGCKKPAKRLWISSQTDKAVRDGFQSLKPAAEYYHLFLSAQSRAEADWLVGMNVTRALTCKHNASLSAGRVQTPTLSMIVEREHEIKRFIAKEFYTIKAKFDGFTALWMGSDKQSRFTDRAAAEAVLNRITDRQGTAVEVKKQYKHQAPPAAYDLTELQRDANRKYAYTAKETLSHMQSLYERHKAVTYPRTDSRYISDDIVPTLPERLQGIAAGPYKDMALSLYKNRPLPVRFLVNNDKVSDHHAIIPTEKPVNLSAFSPEERNIYDLVVRRFLAVLSPLYEYDEVKLTAQIGKDRFYAKGKSVLNPGWKAAYGQALIPEDGDDDSELREQTLPQLRQADRLAVLSVSLETGKTKPPSRYNEATLLTAMENPKGIKSDVPCGLGTPATRADIIEKLFSSFYIERHGKQIVPTSKGIQLVSIVPDELKSAELTAKWEQELSAISKGTVKSESFVKQMRLFSSELVSKVKASDAKYKHDNVTSEKCPDCDEFLLEVKGKKGLMRVCRDRECGYRKSLSMQTNARCPNCHKKLEMRGDGEKRGFYCVCGHREKLVDFEKRRAESGASKRDVTNYLQSQWEKDKNEKPVQSKLALQLAQWEEKQKQNK
jgi:DNA topoisomerase-3